MKKLAMFMISALFIVLSVVTIYGATLNPSVPDRTVYSYQFNYTDSKGEQRIGTAQCFNLNGVTYSHYTSVPDDSDIDSIITPDGYYVNVNPNTEKWVKRGRDSYGIRVYCDDTQCIYLTGWYNDPSSGKWYYFNPWGHMLINTTTPDGYQVNENGEWVKDGVIQVNGNAAVAQAGGTGVALDQFVNYFNSGLNNSGKFYYDETHNTFHYDVYFQNVSKTDSDYQSKRAEIKSIYQDSPTMQALANACEAQVGRNSKLYVIAYTKDNKEICRDIYTGKAQDGVNDFKRFQNGELDLLQIGYMPESSNDSESRNQDELPDNVKSKLWSMTCRLALGELNFPLTAEFPSYTTAHFTWSDEYDCYMITGYCTAKNGYGVPGKVHIASYASYDPDTGRVRVWDVLCV